MQRTKHRRTSRSERASARAALRLAAGLALGVLAACSGPRAASQGSASPASAPRERGPQLWTQSFLEKSVLSAAVVEIDGPELLRERLALRRDEFNHEHGERATSDGYLIEQRQRADSDGSPIRAQLDELVIDAYERIQVRIRPDAQRVVVRASGDVFLFALESGRDTRVATLTLVGELDTPLEP